MQTSLSLHGGDDFSLCPFQNIVESTIVLPTVVTPRHDREGGDAVVHPLHTEVDVGGRDQADHPFQLQRAYFLMR